MRPPLLTADRAVVGEPGARRRVATNVGIIVIAVALPSCAAIVLRPDRPGEGYAFLAAAVLLIGWQARLLRRSGVVVAPEGISRAGSDLVSWSDVEALTWRSVRPPGPHGRDGGAHRLVAVRVASDRATASGSAAKRGDALPLTWWPCTTSEALALTTALRDLGLDVAPPEAG